MTPFHCDWKAGPSGPTVPQVHGLCRRCQREAHDIHLAVPSTGQRAPGVSRRPPSVPREAASVRLPVPEPRVATVRPVYIIQTAGTGSAQRGAPAGVTGSPRGRPGRRCLRTVGRAGPGALVAGIGGSHRTGPWREWTLLSGPREARTHLPQGGKQGQQGGPEESWA